MRSDPAFVLRVALLIVASSLAFTIWMYVSYRALDFEAGIVPIFFAAIATQMSFFFSLTPGNLGVREVVVGFVSQLTGLGFAEGVAVTILQRTVSTVAFAVLGLLFSLLIVSDLTSDSVSSQDTIE
jgi:uncharacterized membrane protein YbhN (UPF0104 family)